MAILKLAVVITRCSSDNEFLLVKQTPPPLFGEEEYDSYIDSDLWDLPSAALNPLLEGKTHSGISIQGSSESSSTEELDLSKYDVASALDQVITKNPISSLLVSMQVGFRIEISGDWVLRKYAQEAEFGPGPPVNTVIIQGKLGFENEHLPVISRWMSVPDCLDLLWNVKPSSDRLGPFIVVGLLADAAQSGKCKIPLSLRCQEYPPGFTIVPMRSRTAKPFLTTNLVVFAPDNISDGCGDSSFAASGDALVVDPGCRIECHAELFEVIAALPKKLVVFVTHHHRDHVEGLSIIQKCNPDAILLAHENTMSRIGKDDWSLSCTTISGGELIRIGGQQFNVVFAPGHTDGHVALLHVNTHSLIVGDHCVGQGSAFLDITSGGNMKEYFRTTFKFLEISPHVLIPMHGRVNLWPKHMLCGYLKNRRNRELSILKAIEDGSETLFDIVAEIYSDVNPSFWIAASSNVRLHVDHLDEQDKLPKGFSVEKFKLSCSEFAEKLGGREPK